MHQQEKLTENKIGHRRAIFHLCRTRVCVCVCVCEHVDVCACVSVFAPFGVESASLAACLQFKQAS